MTQDEIAVMDGGKCILQLRGVRPFLSDKYDITKHPNYKYLSDFDKRNAFDVERYMSLLFLRSRCGSLQVRMAKLLLIRKKSFLKRCHFQSMGMVYKELMSITKKVLENRVRRS